MYKRLITQSIKIAFLFLALTSDLTSCVASKKDKDITWEALTTKNVVKAYIQTKPSEKQKVYIHKDTTTNDLIQMHPEKKRVDLFAKKEDTKPFNKEKDDNKLISSLLSRAIESSPFFLKEKEFKKISIVYGPKGRIKKKSKKKKSKAVPSSGSESDQKSQFMITKPKGTQPPPPPSHGLNP